MGFSKKIHQDMGKHINFNTGIYEKNEKVFLSKVTLKMHISNNKK